MLTYTFTGIFANISQRVAFSYVKSLVPLAPDSDPAECDLHGFFERAYSNIATDPASFGLPLDADITLPRERPAGSMDLQEANRRLAKPRGIIEMGLNFLMAAAQAGTFDRGSLILTPEAYMACQAKPKMVRKFLDGLANAGLVITEDREQVMIGNRLFPGMMAALQSLARACAQYDPPRLGFFHFARCDFNALQPGYKPDVLELYRIFNPVDYAHLENLHHYFTARGYRAGLEVGGIHGWVVKYQGNRKIKASPLFQVEYQERFTNPLDVQIKCASANRITALVAQHSQALQDDFFQRSLRCRSDACNWCQNRKGMEPSTLVYNGQEYATCWYVPPNLGELTDASVALVKEYAEMHEELKN